MGMMDRVKTLLKSNVNHAMAKVEDPERVIHQLVLDMKDQLIEAKKQVAVTIADEKRLKKQAEAELLRAHEWEKKAMMAVQVGRDDLAREALRRKTEHEQTGAQYHAQWEAQKAAADQLREALHQLTRKIEEAERKKRLLISRQRQVEAQRHMQETMQSMNQHAPMERLSQLEARIDQMEAQVQAQRELHEQSAPLEAQIAQLQAHTRLDDELERLKARMSHTSAATSFAFEEVEHTQTTHHSANAPHQAPPKRP